MADRGAGRDVLIGHASYGIAPPLNRSSPQDLRLAGQVNRDGGVVHDDARVIGSGFIPFAKPPRTPRRNALWTVPSLVGASPRKKKCDEHPCRRPCGNPDPPPWHRCRWPCSLPRSENHERYRTVGVGRREHQEPADFSQQGVMLGANRPLTGDVVPASRRPGRRTVAGERPISTEHHSLPGKIGRFLVFAATDPNGAIPFMILDFGNEHGHLHRCDGGGSGFPQGRRHGWRASPAIQTRGQRLLLDPEGCASDAGPA